MSDIAFAFVRHIYLDQNKWIDLARAVHGAGDGECFEAARNALEAKIKAEKISLPLSTAHYIETQNRREWKSRRKLAETMLAFSKLHTIAPQERLLPGEIDAALNARFGAPAQVRDVRPFGFGISHAFGMAIKPYRVPEELRDRVPDLAEFERRANLLQEQHLLIGPSPEGEQEGIPGYAPLAHLRVGERFAEAKEKLRALRKPEGWHKGERGERVAKAQAVSDHLPVIEEAMARAGLSVNALIEEGEEGMSSFVEEVPTMLASSELERLRHAASQKPWERQDLSDIGSLSVAITHCDIVVTERLWADAAQRSKLDEKLGTVVARHLDDRPELLLELD